MAGKVKLSETDREELDALAHINKVLGRDSFIMRFHWREGYGRLVRRGLVRWRAPPKGFDRRRFAGIHITAKGRAALAESSHG
jgi:hypothetical protein